MTRKTYPTDAQWKLIEPIPPGAKPGVRPRSVDLRAVLDGIFSVVKGGVPWRMLPNDRPPRGAVVCLRGRVRSTNESHSVDRALSSGPHPQAIMEVDRLAAPVTPIRPPAREVMPQLQPEGH